MKTPEGWSRATLLLRTLRAPPPKGSLQESALILYLIRQEDIEHARFRALAQIIVDKKKGVETFDDYMKIAFPYMESVKAKEKSEVIEQLKKEISRGAIGITPIVAQKIKSKLKSKVAQRQVPQTREESNALYKRMGSTLS